LREDLDFMKKIADFTEVYKNIIYIDEITQDETLKEIKQSNAVILASRGDSYPTVIIEALMLDKTVICSNKTGVSSSITNEKNGFVFDINKPEDLTKYMKTIIDNPNIIEKNVAKSLFLEKFHFEVYRNQVKQMLNDIKIMN